MRSDRACRLPMKPRCGRHARLGLRPGLVQARAARLMTTSCVRSGISRRAGRKRAGPAVGDAADEAHARCARRPQSAQRIADEEHVAAPSRWRREDVADDLRLFRRRAAHLDEPAVEAAPGDDAAELVVRRAGDDEHRPPPVRPRSSASAPGTQSQATTSSSTSARETLAEHIERRLVQFDAEQRPMAPADLLAPGDAAVGPVVGDRSLDHRRAVRAVERHEGARLDVLRLDDHPVEVEDQPRHDRSRAGRLPSPPLRRLNGDVGHALTSALRPAVLPALGRRVVLAAGLDPAAPAAVSSLFQNGARSSAGR